MIEVEVMYADLSTVCVPYDKKDILSLSGVQALVVRDTFVKGKKGNIAIGIGFDNYALCERIANGALWIEIYSWDDDDFVWHRTTNHCDPDARVHADPPLGCMHMIFRGQSIPDADWEKALYKLDKEIF